jgi:hypothetical protein
MKRLCLSTSPSLASTTSIHSFSARRTERRIGSSFLQIGQVGERKKMRVERP